MQPKVFNKIGRGKKKKVNFLTTVSFLLISGLVSFSLTGCGGGGGGGSSSTSEGPINPALFSGWEMTNGPFNGMVSSLTVDPNNSQRIYAAVDNGGLFRSDDGGKNWAHIGGGLESLSISAVAVAWDSQTIYAGTRGDGIYKSADGGVTWAEVNNGLPKDPGTGGRQYYWLDEIQVDPTNTQTAYAIMNTRYYLYKTTDGQNWTKIEGLPEIQLKALAVHPDNPQWLYVGTYTDFLWKSEDGGLTWSSKRGNVPPYIVHVSCIGIDPGDPIGPDDDIIYAGTHDYGLYRTLDDGNIWQFIEIEGLTVLDNWSVDALAMDPVDKSTLYVYLETVTPVIPEEDGLYRTFNGGIDWEKVPFHEDPGTYRPVREITIAPSDGNVVYVSTQGEGLFMTNDVMNVAKVDEWEPIHNGLVNLPVYATMLHPGDNKIVYAGTSRGLFKTADGGSTWERKGLNGRSVYALASDPDDPSIIYASTSNGVYKTTDGGESWSEPNIYRFNCLAIGKDPQNPDVNIIFGGYDSGMGIYKAMDDGSIPWDQVTWGEKNTGLSDDEKYVNCLAIDPSDPSILYAGTGYMSMPGPETAGKVIKTLDGGETWEPKLDGLPPDEPIYSLALDPYNPQILYAGTYVGIYGSSDGGDHWQFKGVDFGIDSIAIDPMDSMKICAGTYEDGVFASIDGGENWTQINQGLTCDLNKRIISLAMDLGDIENAAVYAGTGCGVFKAYK